jgi:Organic solute transporter Ostalpha
MLSAEESCSHISNKMSNSNTFAVAPIMTIRSSNPQEDDHAVVTITAATIGEPNHQLSHSYYSNQEPLNSRLSTNDTVIHHNRNEEDDEEDENEHEALLGVPATAAAAKAFASSSAPRHRCCQRCCFLCTRCASLRARYCTMQCVATFVLWGTITSLLIAIVWYSYELFNHGTDPHLIAWFSAGAFVLLGFPISMMGIIGHLTNYNAPHIQVYIVRILWMVPIYSIESWLAMRFHKQAVFIETARDVYESFVLYCFLQFLIQVLGGEEALILMLKDKSPTRGVHVCYGMEKILGFKPWLMGQPIRRSVYTAPYHPSLATNHNIDCASPIVRDPQDDNSKSSTLYDTEVGGKIYETAHHPTLASPYELQPHRVSVVERVTAALSPTPSPHPRMSSPSMMPSSQATTNPLFLVPASPPNTATTTKVMAAPPGAAATYYRVHWTSPFFIQCKFGVLQYVLIKLFCAMATLILEYNDWYQEGSFSYTSGYLYICILTNVSQCYALYCLIFFYYATKNELSPIRPVGKFISVKAIVFFTWWQSVLISVLYQMDMIPNYKASNAEKDWNSEDVAKGIQDYLICIEMFIAAIVHSVVFPHSEYTIAAVRARDNATSMGPGYRASRGALDGSGRIHTKRLGRRRHRYHHPLMCMQPPAVGDDKSTEDVDTRGIPGDVELMGVTAAVQNDDNRTVDSNDDNSSFGTWGSRESLRFGTQERQLPSRLPIYDLDSDDDLAVGADVDSPHLSQFKTTPTGASSTASINSKTDKPADLKKPGLFRAFIDSAIPRDLHDNTVDLLLQRGDFLAGSNKKTLLHHAATSDQYDLFAKNSIAKASRRYNNAARSSNHHSATTSASSHAKATSSSNTGIKKVPSSES